MAGDLYKLRSKFSALGAGDAGQHNNELIEAPEDEDEVNMMNDETFGGDIDVDFDWEEEHERFAEITEPSPVGSKTCDSGYQTNERSYRSQEEYMEHSISQLVVDDEDEIDDPAILNVSKSRPIPKKAQNLDEIFGPSSPPGFLDTEHLVSPSSKNIWGSPVKESDMPPAPPKSTINNLQSLFEFAKAASHGHLKDPHSMSTPESKVHQRPPQEVPGTTLEALENMLQHPKTIKTPVTAEDLEREMRKESADQRVPQMPIHYPIRPHMPPPPHIPPPGMPGMMGSPMGSPMGPRMHHTPPVQRIPPGFSPIPQQFIPDGRHSPLQTGMISSTPPHLGRVSPLAMIHRQSPLATGLSPITRTTPSPPPHIPQARMIPPYAARSAILSNMIAKRGQTQPIGIPRQPPPRMPVNHAGSPYNSPGGPYHSPSNGPYHSPGGPYHSPGNGTSPGPRGHYPSPQNNQRYQRGRGGRGYHNDRYREGYNNRDYYDRNHSNYDRNQNNNDRDRNYHNNFNGDHRYNNRRYYDRDRENNNKNDDEYAGIMTQKEKDWIIKIQLMQLQTDNPYLDDFYFTTYTLKKKAMERQKLKENGMDEKNKDPTLIIPALGKLETKAYKPAQFEGSLGRLTTSSVHNPRQIIDVRSNSSPGPEDSESKNTSKELRKSRILLTEIEKGYNLLLEVDDIEKRTLALPEEARIPLYEDRKDLILHLYKYLLHEDSSEHFMSIMSVRKGRKLVARVIPLLDRTQSESVLLFLLKNLQALIKKDQKEEGLMVLHDPVINAVDTCDLESLVKFSKELQIESIPHQSKSVAVAIQNQFGSSVIGSLLNRGEVLYTKTSPLDLDNQLQTIWCQFVHDFAGILAVVPTESLVHPKFHHACITDHFDRLLNKKLLALVEDKVKLFTEPETS